jgi:hypothetical protein
MPEPQPTIKQLQADNKALQKKIDDLRELGDALWYCLRHRLLITKEEVNEATEEWIQYR